MMSAKTATSAAMKKRGAAVAFNEKEGGGASQDSEDFRECVICLDQLSTKVVGSLDSCEHRFCFECIESWGTTRENTCPLCKARFKTITKHDPQDAAKSGSGGSKGKGRKKRPQKITVQDRDQASSLEPPIPQRFLFPTPFILFNPQNYMDFGPDFADDDDDEDDDAVALATLENFLVDPLAAFARLATGAAGGGGVGGQVMMADNLFHTAAPAPLPPRYTGRAPHAPSDPVATLVEFSRRNAQNGGLRAAPAPRFGFGSGGGASSGSSSRTFSSSDGVGSSSSNPVVLVNECSDNDSDEVHIVSGPASSGSVPSRVRRHAQRERNDDAWKLAFDLPPARTNVGSSSSSSGASSSEANHATARVASASSSMYTRGRRARGAQRQAQESGGGGAVAAALSTASNPTSRAESFRMTGGTPIANIPAPMPRRTPTVTFNDPEVEGLSPARRAPRARAARSRTVGRNASDYYWGDREDEEQWEL